MKWVVLDPETPVSSAVSCSVGSAQKKDVGRIREGMVRKIKVI